MKILVLPERILIIFLSIFSVVQCIDEYDFLVSNRCGCFLEYPLCHEKNELVSQPKDLVFAAFPSVTPCRKMFLDGYNISKTDEINGNIRLSLLLNPSRPDEVLDFRVVLLVAVDGSNDMAIQQSRSYNVSFSTKSVFQVDFSYLYSGTYQLEFLSPAKCQSRNFTISSSYQREKLTEPYFQYKFTSESIIIVSFSNNGLELAEKVEIIFYKVYRSSLTEESWRKLKTVVLSKHGSNETCCSSIKMDGIEGDNQEFSVKSPTCPCFWDGFKIRCLFLNVSEGLYSAEIHFIDRRCENNTIWIKGNESCSWFYYIVATGASYPAVFKMPLLSQSQGSFYWPYLILGLCMVSLICVAIFIWKKKSFINFKESKENFGLIRRFFIGATVKFYTILYISKPQLFVDNAREKYAILPNSQPALLLLYPRDCNAFMKTMVKLRENLEKSNFLVHDPWDDENYDNVVESFETWAISLLKNHSTKIIIILSECSKAFEQAFLDNSIVEYYHPQLLDSIFRQSLSSIHRYFAARFDMYQRVFVVRFDETENFNFITPETVYTLPMNMNLLIEELGGSPENLNAHLFMQLNMYAAEYNNFKRTNNGYLDLLLRVYPRNDP